MRCFSGVADHMAGHMADCMVDRMVDNHDAVLESPIIIFLRDDSSRSSADNTALRLVSHGAPLGSSTVAGNRPERRTTTPMLNHRGDNVCCWSPRD